MFSTIYGNTKRAALIFILATAWGSLVHAQMTQGPGLSSGSGAGTGAGGFSGVLRNDSGSISGVGPGPSGSGTMIRGRPVPMLPGASNERNLVGFGPGVDVTFPNDPYLLPFLSMEEAGGPFDPQIPTRVTNDLLTNARLITTPEERSLALQRIANGAIASSQLTLAHKTLEEAITAASDVTVPLVRDQRLIAIVTSYTQLTDALMREGREIQNGVLLVEADVAAPEPLPKRLDSTMLIRLARLEWKRAVYLASIIGNPTYRNEMLYKVAENEASGSASISNEFIKATETETLGDRPPRAQGAEREKRPTVDDRARARQAANENFKKLADAILINSFEDAKKIDRLIWKYRAMVRIALLAADSQQYTRGVELSRGIDNGESRAEAMLILAESMCRKNQKELNAAATEPYEEAARAVASVRQAGLRGVLVGFLVDSLISTGRFDDARACVVIYPEPSQKLVALGAIAETQGRRGSAAAARQWIARDVPEEYRPALYRRVTSGVLWAIDQNRSKEFLRSEGAPTTPGR
jgi:hypothetical protein